MKYTMRYWYDAEWCRMMQSFKFSLLTCHSHMQTSSESSSVSRHRNMKGGPKAGSTAAQPWIRITNPSEVQASPRPKANTLDEAKQLRESDPGLCMFMWIMFEICQYVWHCVHPWMQCLECCSGFPLARACSALARPNSPASARGALYVTEETTSRSFPIGIWLIPQRHVWKRSQDSLGEAQLWSRVSQPENLGECCTRFPGLPSKIAPWQKQRYVTTYPLTMRLT
jgi:hypothetical protein